MLPGFTGHLISESFIERCLGDRASIGSTDDETVRLGRALELWRRRSGGLGPASALLAILESGAKPLTRALGFDWVGRTVASKGVLAATIASGDEPVSLVCAGWGEPLDPLWRSGVEHAARAGAAWCVFFNGTHVRLVDARRVYTRRYAEFDIDLALDSSRAVAALALVLGARAFPSAPGNVSVLQRLVDASDRHATTVCRSLRGGVFDASTALLGALVERRRNTPIDVAFEQTLTIVYRILFLLFAEARDLLPLWHPIYRNSYSLEALCDVAARSRSSTGLWDAIRATSRLAHCGCRVGDLHVAPFNGRLFAPGRTPLVERRDLNDEAAKRALVALSTRPSDDRQGRERIAYRDLGVEELGGVYESLLDYQPTAALSLRDGSGRRKATGTFYTPRRIAEYLVRRTLAPLVEHAPPEQILALKVLDPSMGSGAFLVAACSYLAQAYEAALVDAGGSHPADFGPEERAAIRRAIAERCLFGVDLNPMAVQLSRLSMWLATLAAGRPLSFLDHHLLCGDSLLGAWLSSLRAPPAQGRRKAPPMALPLFDDRLLPDIMRVAVPARFRLGDTPNDTAEQVHQKERTLAELNGRNTALSRWRRVADLWCAGWFLDAQDRPPASAFGALSDAVLSGGGALPKGTAARYIASAERVAGVCRFFHWELEFPEVFFAADGTRRADGGFDAILGNPPWDMVRGDSGPADRRDEARETANAVLRFTRDSGVYASQSAGHANRYQLFVERAIALTRPGGRVGLVLPSGLASDHGSAPLRRMLFSSCAVDAIVGFENSAGIFPIHRSVRFHLVTATAGMPTREFGCRLGERDPGVLESDAGERDWFPVRVTPPLLERVCGDDMAVPDFRSPRDVAISERAAALFPPLGSAESWSARFGRELNATDDREHFHTGGSGLPVLEGKALEPFRVSVMEPRFRISSARARRLLGERCFKPRLAYRDVASSTNRVTLIAAILPAGAVSTHTVFCLRTPLASHAQHLLCGLFNSFVVNYLVRLRVTTHVTTAIVERLPIPHARARPELCSEIASLARFLARREEAGVVATLNARVAELYQLTHADFVHVLDTFPLVPREDRARALAAFAHTRVVGM